MKNHVLKALIGLVFLMSCSKTNVDAEFSEGLEQRGNDNHKIWNLSQVDFNYAYTLTDGSQGTGDRKLNYEYSCVRPYGRAVAFSDHAVEDGALLWDNSSTMTYNDNFMIDVEHAQEYGADVVRTFHYDSDYKWTGITTEINGEVIDEEIEIGPGGQVKSYTSGGVRTEYTWKADNAKTLKIYVQPSAELRSVENSLAFNKSGINEISRRATKQLVLKAFKDLQQVAKRSSSLRSIQSDGWVLVGIEENYFDLNVIEPYRSTAKGYPGTTSDGGYYNLSKNFSTGWKGVLVEPDGTPISDYYSYERSSYSVKNNLPVVSHYTYIINGYSQDADGNPIDYREEGTEHYEYISGCNQKEN